MFAAMREYAHGNILDVGGFDFFLKTRQKGIPFDHWTTIDPSGDTMPEIHDERFTFVVGDGCNMPEIPSNTFDTALSLQVVEHVFEPIRMVEEIHRVLKPGGIAIFLIPQTSILHFAPHHYYNFTRYWIYRVMEQTKFEIVLLEALGGRWSSTASHLVFFLLQSLRWKGMTVPEEKRPFLFYVLYPFMLVTSLILIPLCMLFSLGDLKEEPNNHLVVVRKASKQ